MIGAELRKDEASAQCGLLASELAPFRVSYIKEFQRALVLYHLDIVRMSEDKRSFCESEQRHAT